MLRVVEKDGIQEHRFVCDSCGAILEGKGPNERVVWVLTTEENPSLAHHACSVGCHKKIEAALENNGGRTGWAYIEEHVSYLAAKS